MATQKFQELLVWQKAHAFVLAVYAYCKKFSDDEKYILTAQFKRAAISIAANIAESYKKRSRPDKARFLNIARGSLEESQYYLIHAEDLGYGNNTALRLLLDEVGKMLFVYSRQILSSGP
jgi:four helix bundle protein